MSKRARKSSANGNGEQFHSDEALFDYSGNATFKPRKKFPIHNSQITPVDPKQNTFHNTNPKQLDFEIVSTKTLLMSPMFRFEIRGGFQRKKATVPAAGNAPAQEFDWEKIPETEVTEVMVQPNWLEYLIKSVEVYSGNSRLTTYGEDKSLTPHINTFINSYQDKDTLHLSAPQKYHPFRYGPSFDKDSLDIKSKEWTEYAKTIFVNEELVIDYYPRVFPFVQSVNKFDKSDKSKPLPMPLIGKLNVRVTFVDDMGCIFRKKDGNQTNYQFYFEKFRLIIEEANLHLPFEKSLFSTKKTLVFPGLCRLSKIESLPTATPSFRTKFSDTFMPQGLLVMAMNKSIAQSQYSFANDKASKNMFMPHNIHKIDLSFNHLSFDIKEPTPANLTWDMFDVQTYMNHRKCPIFGLKPDVKHLTISHFEEGGANSSYPHFYMPLTQYYGDIWTRKVPALDDGGCLNKMSTLDIFLTFDKGGSTENAVYVFIIFFTDFCLAYDPKNKIFLSPHGVPQG